MKPSIPRKAALLAGLLGCFAFEPVALSQNYGNPYGDQNEQYSTSNQSGYGQTQLPTNAVLYVTTTDNLQGFVIKQYLGLVRGVTVRQPTMGQNFMAGIQGSMGPDIDAYAQMCDQARERSLQRLIQHAQALGANAVIGLRFDSSPVNASPFETEVLCYGTAVVIAKLR
jgi:uncharacterized protein YbjQ (UPF0145 family)